MFDGEQLQRLLTTEMPYGKYQGRLIADLPGDYQGLSARFASRAAWLLRDEPQGAKPKASLDGLPGFATKWIARKTTPLRVRTKTGPLPTKPLACAAAHAAWCWRSNHPVLDSNAHDANRADHPYWFARVGFPPGELGRLLALMHEIDHNGLSGLLAPLRKP